MDEQCVEESLVKLEGEGELLHHLRWWTRRVIHKSLPPPPPAHLPNCVQEEKKHGCLFSFRCSCYRVVPQTELVTSVQPLPLNQFNKTRANCLSG